MSAPPDSLLRTLEGVAGAQALSQHAPVSVDDNAFAWSLRPANAEALAACLEALSEARVGAVVRGGATRIGLGNAPRGAALLLDTRGLAGVDQFESAEGVCRAGAGTSLSQLREKVRAGGWELPLDAPGNGATLGGSIAAAAFGPRALGYGVPRDLVLGLDVSLASGARTRCGGRVVKNVTGYDLCKLYTGSFGALGVIEAVWLRLRPLPEATVVLEVRGDDPDLLFAAAIDASRRPATRAVALQISALSAGSGCSCVVELAGDAIAVEDERAAIAALLGAEEADTAALDELRALQIGAGVVVRVSTLASKLATTAAALRSAGAELLVYPGLGVVYARFEAPLPDAFARATAIAAGAGGQARLEAAPAELKQNVDVFGPADPALPLQRALKARFDPHGVLNPGRPAGRL